MIKTAILLGFFLTCCNAQLEFASVLEVLTKASGLPAIEYLIENSPNEVSSQCLNDLQTYLSDLSIGSRYARKLASSFGEFPDESVEFTWTAYDYGVMEQCLDVNKDDEDNSTFDAHYCMAMTMISTLEVHIGTCWPSSCENQDAQVISTQLSLLLLNSTDPGLNFVCLARPAWDQDAIAVLTFFCVVASLVLIGTIYDLYIRKHCISASGLSKDQTNSMTTKTVVNGFVNEKYTPTDEENSSSKNDLESEIPPKEAYPSMPAAPEGTAIQSMSMASLQQSHEPRRESTEQETEKKAGKLDGVLMSYSAATNLRLILSAKPSRSNLGVLNGLRVISMFWIILLHCNLFLYGSKKLDNYYTILSTSTKFPRMAIHYGTFGVDTFFVIGGLLVTYTTLLKLRKSDGQMNWLMFYFHRYWRLTPALLGALALWISLGKHLAGQGAMFEIFYGYVRYWCKQEWWTYPLYINNLYPFPGNNNASCMGWAWYLACDMQFYLMSPLIITLLYRKKHLGIGLILCLTTASIASAVGISWNYGVNPVGPEFNDRLGGESLDITYTKPYTRIHSYLVGMFVGYLLFRTVDRKIKIPWWFVLIGWSAAFILGMTCVYSLYGARMNPDTMEQFEAVLWEGLSRFAWSIAIAWVCFSCIKGYGGIINSFLSWNFWIPMGRLTYCAYLIHPLVIYNALMSGKALFHFGIISFSFYFVGSVVFSYLAALILSLLMEVPAAGLEKVLFGRD
ncbi:nose resistant to fluoxetine protein 6-like [Lytechinus pictus]|uniref:nose resistant to fluoxetine protein 6-like n=1 Tax=Lytechinus pictus TaxID=7653 RepID=UPI0030B9AF97